LKEKGKHKKGSGPSPRNHLRENCDPARVGIFRTQRRGEKGGKRLETVGKAIHLKKGGVPSGSTMRPFHRGRKEAKR